MTISELKELIKDAPGDMQVILYHRNEFFAPCMTHSGIVERADMPNEIEIIEEDEENIPVKMLLLIPDYDAEAEVGKD